jgi:exopolysaccharide production protein ExoQ
MRKLLVFAEQAFTVLSLTIYSQGVLLLILSGGANQEDDTDYDTALLRVVLFFIYAATSFLLVVRWKKVISGLSKDGFIWVLVGMATVSVLWSEAPAITIPRSVALIGTTLFGLYLASRYSMRQQLQLLGWMFGLAIVLSIVFAVALPSYGLMGGVHAGAWRGIYTHKNFLGASMSVSAIVFLLLTMGAKKNRLLIWCGLSLSVTLLFLSCSTSALLNLVFLLVLLPLYQSLRWRYDLMIPAIIAIATLGGIVQLWITNNPDTLLVAVGKDTTLTGRTDMWPYVLDMIWKRPWLGYGYSAFWQGLNGPSASIWYATGWNPTHPHNGLLALWLDLGLLGVLIFAAGFLISFLGALAWVRKSRTSEALWPGLYMTYMFLSNLTETNLLKSNSLGWVLYVAAALSVLSPSEQPAKMVASMPSQ